MSEEITVHVVKYKDRDNLVMRYLCPLTNKQVSRSTGTGRQKEAEKVAAKWEAELREGRYRQSPRMGWDEFVAQWRVANEPRLRSSTIEKYDATFTAYAKHIRPERLSDLTTAKVTAFTAALRADGLSEATVKRHLSVLLTVSRWAYRQELIAKVPAIDMPKGLERMKGRPVTLEEFERMLEAVPEVVIEHMPEDASQEWIDNDPRVTSWRELLLGLWWSGLRLGEALNLRWEQTPRGVWVTLDGRESTLSFDGAQKSGQVEIVPLAPEAAAFLESKRQETGYVFSPLRLRGGETMQRNPHKVGQIISKIGDKAGVVVNHETGKTASAHDLRRAFGFRWARRAGVSPALLMELMRHKDIKTTLTFYAGRDAKSASAALWNALGTKSGNSADSGCASESENPMKNKAPTAGFEPATPALGKPCSIP